VASAGLDFYIEPVIRNAGFDQAEVHSGRVVSEATQPPPFRYDYPSVERASKTNPCKGDWVTCKCEVIRQLKQRDNENEPETEVIFVGDGVLSDTCAAENEADTVFATGRLLEYCRENQIPAIEFGEDFAPVLEYVKKNTSENGDR
jgi:2-hydroxy-3-keto-5-methylthiopentenyl-1-phosphate phosphatase